MWLLWILSLTASFLLPATGEVVNNFRPCKEFFLDGKPPTLKPMDPARICQFYQSKYRFATMYDRKGRIPTFSAYKYQPGEGRRNEQWKIEPQLALPMKRSRKSMELEEDCEIDRDLLKNSQAVFEDYGHSVYDRGHLLPAFHQPDQDSKDATFTLTNIVPQLRQLNQGKWAEYERSMSKSTRGCRHTYVLVGAVPGNKTLNKRVKIPSHIWAAACCVTQGNRKRSWGVIAENNQNHTVHSSLKQLEMKLAIHYRKKEINLFNRACYSGDTRPNNFTEQIHAGYKLSSLLV